MKSLDLRLRLAVIGVLVWLTADFGVAISGALKIAALGGAGAIWSQPALQRVDSFTDVTAVIYTVAYIASVILVARWIYRANANAHSLSDHMTITPFWAVAWYFVPIASLFKPYQAMRETWRVSLSPYNPDSVPVPPSFQIWWGLWVATNLLGNVSFRMSLNATSAHALMLGGWVDIIALVIDVPLTVLLIIIMRQVTANQRSIVDSSIFD